jgi:hypothetical protein
MDTSMRDTSEREAELLDDLRVVLDDLIHYLDGIRLDVETGEYGADVAALDYDILASSEVGGFMEIIQELSSLRTSKDEDAESASA